MVVELYPHQQKAVDAMHNGCVLRGDVGTGKTITALMYYVTKVCKGVPNDLGSMRDPKSVIVITTAKKRDSLDWQKDAALLGLFKNPEHNPHHISVTVDSWNNITKYEEEEDVFFIFDEQRLVGAGAWTKSFVKIARHNEWILLSATPGDVWLDYIPVFIANGFYKNRTEFKRRHVVYNNYSKFPKVERYMEAGVLVRHRNSILVEMPYKRHTKRHLVERIVDYNIEKFKKVVEDRWHVYEDRPIRDVAELFSVMRKVVNSDSSRLDTIRELMKKHPRLIVFYNFDYELDELRTLAVDSSPTLRPEETSKSPETAMEEPLDFSTNPGVHGLGETSTLMECPGHWTDDLGDGEYFLTCKDDYCWVPDGQFDEAGEPTGDWEYCGGDWGCNSEWGAWERFREEDKVWDPKSDTSSQRKISKRYSTPSTPSPGSEIGSAIGLISSGLLSHETPSTNSSLTSRPSEPADRSALPSTIDSEQNTLTTETASESSEELVTLGAHGLVVAEWNGHKHEEVPDSERWLYLVNYRAGSEGWNCVATDAMVFYSLTYSYRDFYQAQGRIDRLNTLYTDLYYYVLMSRSLIDQMIVKSLKGKESFNEAKSSLGRKFKEKMGLVA